MNHSATSFTDLPFDFEAFPAPRLPIKRAVTASIVIHGVAFITFFSLGYISLSKPEILDTAAVDVYFVGAPTRAPLQVITQRTVTPQHSEQRVEKVISPIKKETSRTIQDAPQSQTQQGAAQGSTQTRSSQDVNDATLQNGGGSYHEVLASWINRHKRYPERARKRNIEGSVLLGITVARDGSLVASEISKSSGSTILDTGAQEMLQEAQPFPALPSTIHGATYSVQVPVHFSLQE
jgi:TonB family protein